jgi:hypothetical protein
MCQLVLERFWHLVDILSTCCIIHNMLIADREELGDGRTIGTRNIVSFDEAAPPSDLVTFAPADTREAQAMHWCETADLVENKEQHFSLKNAIATYLWNKLDSVDDDE